MRALAIVAALLAATAAARAAEINAFISAAIKAVTDELLPPFERANGYTIRAAYAPSGEPIYYDETHLTLLASERLGETITSRAGVPPAFHLSVKNPSVRR